MDQQGVHDRISELPNDLIIQILCLLDMKDVVKTRVLSKRWEYLWTKVNSFVFNFYSEERHWEKLQQFLLGGYRTLMQCTCSNINEFSLRINGYFCFRDDIEISLDNWLEFLVNKNIKNVEVRLAIGYYTGPICFYRNPSFVRLALEGFCLYQETEYINWPSLKSLSLKQVDLEDAMKDILDGCPILESLVLDEVEGLSEHLNITSPSVKKLKLLNFHHEDFCDGDYINICFQIEIPWVEELEIEGHFVDVECQLLDVSSLNYVSLSFNYSASTLEIENSVEVLWENMVDKMLNQVCHVDEIVLGSDLVQAMSLSKLVDRPHPTFKCKHLTVHSRNLHVYEVPGIVCLLQSMPYLETVIFKMSLLGASGGCGFITDIIPWHDCVTTYFSDYFSFEGNDYLATQIGNFKHLKNVKIDYVEHRSHGLYDECFDFEVVAYILRNAPILEKLVILASKSSGTEFPIDRASRYLSLMSSQSMIGKKAEHWELKKENSFFEFCFCKNK